MKILKYKKKKDNKYLISLDNNNDIELFEEVILNNNLLLKKEIDMKDINRLIKENSFYECYYKALKLIKTKLRSVYEIKTKLIKDEYDIDDILKVIDKLLKQGYLNDLFYATSYINNQIITTYHGPLKIRNDLKKNGVDDSIITEALNNYDDNIEEEKITKIIDRMIRSNRNKSNNYLKRKIYNDLLKEGFSKKIIDRVLSVKEFNDDSDIKEREYEKIKNRLSKKYSDKELEYKIKEAMIRKGFYI